MRELISNLEQQNDTRILLGDFNDWTRSLPTRLFSAHFAGEDIRRKLQRKRTYPGILPLIHLDHIYYDPGLVLKGAMLHISRKALIASDHLPLVADFRL
ncbi:MAG: Endonuclease/exonuclease/phosphatase [Deltaproteobacteria bacterium]|nr:Endonuclease/exonuclease/phosphatase [Deltaproteobacteria bacterium]